MKSTKLAGLLALSGCVGLGCTSRINDVPGNGNTATPGAGGSTGTPGASGMTGSGNGTSAGGSDPSASGGTSSTPGATGGTATVDPGMVTAPKTPFEAAAALVALRKVKNLLTGLAPTDAEVATVQGSGAAGLQMLINTWMTQADTQNAFRDKMIFFFRNLFQQTGFVATEDFKPQLLTNGGFDFGGFGGPGDDAFARLVQNLQDSFALTTWGLIAEGRPFTDTLSTNRYMMTTGLKSLYLQIEQPREQRNAATPTLSFKVDESGVEIPIEQSLDNTSPNYMVFSDVAPVNPGRTGNGTICRGTAGMVTVEDVVVEGATVCARWTWRGTHVGELRGIPPTGCVAETTGVHWITVRGGTIAESWVAYDALGLFSRLGLIWVGAAAAA